MNNESEENATVKDFNVGDFYGEHEMSFLVDNIYGSNEKCLIPFINKGNKIFLVMELFDNEI